MDLDVSRPRIVGNHLIYKGFIYVRSKAGPGGRFNWACRKLRRGECKARIVTIPGEDGLTVLKESEHSHPADPEEAKAEIVQRNLKRTAEEHPELPPAQILRTELSQLGPEVLSKLPERNNIKKNLRRYRRKDLPANPQSLEQLADLPDRFRNKLAGEVFLLYDSAVDEEFDDDSGRVLGFGTRRNLELLANSTSWYLDGTFSVSPNIFAQVFTVIGVITRPGRRANDENLHVPFPLVYALLSSKTSSQYEAVLRAITTAAEDFGLRHCRPQRIVSDFEMAILNASTAVFPDTSIVCCFFHLGQSIYRRIQNEGLQAAYQDPEDNTIRKYSHMLLALAMVPVQDVITAFLLLLDDAPDQFTVMCKYFDENYIRGRPRRGRARAVLPRYPIALWNQYEATLQGLHRTNNVSEGWHNRFRMVVGKKHPDLYSCLVEFQKEQRDTEACIIEMDLGRAVKAAPKKNWIAVQERMRRIAEGYETYRNEDRLLNYLENMSYNINIS